MDAAAGLTGQQRGCLQEIWQREDACFRARIPKSLASGSTARGSMPSGAPMAWMAGYYRTPPPGVSRGEGARFTDVDGHTYLDFGARPPSPGGPSRPRPARLQVEAPDSSRPPRAWRLR